MTLIPVSNICSSVDWSSSVGRRPMDWPSFLGLNRPVRKVDRLAEDVEHATQHFRADRHRNRRAQVDRGHAALHTVGRLHRNGTHSAFAQMLLNLGDDVDVDGALIGLDMQRVVDGGQMPLELHVEDWPDPCTTCRLSVPLLYRSPCSKRPYCLLAPSVSRAARGEKSSHIRPALHSACLGCFSVTYCPIFPRGPCPDRGRHRPRCDAGPSANPQATFPPSAAHAQLRTGRGRGRD